MLLTLSASCLRARLAAARSDSAHLQVTDLPRYARDTLNLHGLNIATDLLAGADLEKLDAVREAADKASCPCLVLIEPTPLPLAHPDDARGEVAIERMTRVLRAAHRLGCNGAAVGVEGTDDAGAFDLAAERLRTVLNKADRLEVNILLASAPGLTAAPERLTELIKKVGGFRIGTFPDFEAASRVADPAHFLRRLAPYATAVTASAISFKTTRKPPGFVHEPYDLAAYAEVIADVGYQGTLAIDFRGQGDVEVGIERTRRILETALGQEVQQA